MGKSFDNFWNFLFAEILYGFLVVIGYILFIIPGIIWSIKFMFVPFLIIDKKMKVSEAFKTSNKMASGVQWDLFGFIILSILIEIAGVICFGVGIFVSIPLIWMAMLYIYKDLYKQLNASSTKDKE